MSSHAGLADQNVAPAPDASCPNRRSAPRYVLKVPVEILLLGGRGTGTVWDMSTSGARIEHSSCEPVEGERAALQMSFFPGSLPVQLAGTVIRKTELGGFCVHFESLNPRTRQILVRALPKVSSVRADSQEQVSTYSGQMLVSVGAEVQQACIQAAESAGQSLTTWLGEHLKKAASEDLGNAQADGTRGHDPSTCSDCKRKARSGSGRVG